MRQFFQKELQSIRIYFIGCNVPKIIGYNLDGLLNEPNPNLVLNGSVAEIDRIKVDVFIDFNTPELKLNNLGSPRSAEEKKLKATIIQKIFGTTSKTEIERIDYKLLSHLRDDLEKLFSQLKEREDKIEFVESFTHGKAA